MDVTDIGPDKCNVNDWNDEGCGPRLKAFTAMATPTCGDQVVPITQEPGPGFMCYP